MTEEITDFVDSDPFCRHYSELPCPETCARCGHKCGEHGIGIHDDENCDRDGCNCPGWVERVKP